MIDYLEVKPNLIFIWFAIPFVDRLWLSFILEILFADGSGDFSVNLSSIEAAITYPGICLWLIACLATLAINVISLDNESDEFYTFVFGSKLRIYLVTIINYLLRNFFLCYQTVSLSTFWDPRPSNYTISFIMTIKLVSWIWIRSCPLWHLIISSIFAFDYIKWSNSSLSTFWANTSFNAFMVIPLFACRSVLSVKFPNVNPPFPICDRT